MGWDFDGGSSGRNGKVPSSQPHVLGAGQRRGGARVACVHGGTGAGSRARCRGCGYSKVLSTIRVSGPLFGSRMYESWMCGDTVYGGAWVLSHITFHISHFQSESLCFAPNPSRSTFSGSRMGGRGGRVGHIFITFSYFCVCLSLCRLFRREDTLFRRFWGAAGGVWNCDISHFQLGWTRFFSTPFGTVGYHNLTYCFCFWPQRARFCPPPLRDCGLSSVANSPFLVWGGRARFCHPFWGCGLSHITLFCRWEGGRHVFSAVFGVESVVSRIVYVSAAGGHVVGVPAARRRVTFLPLGVSAARRRDGDTFLVGWRLVPVPVS